MIETTTEISQDTVCGGNFVKIWYENQWEHPCILHGRSRVNYFIHIKLALISCVVTLQGKNFRRIGLLKNHPKNKLFDLIWWPDYFYTIYKTYTTVYFRININTDKLHKYRYFSKVEIEGNSQNIDQKYKKLPKLAWNFENLVHISYAFKSVFPLNFIFTSGFRKS